MATSSLARAQARLEAAAARHDRAASKLYDLLGFGTSQEIAKQRVTVDNARTELRRAEAAVARALGDADSPE